jgi:hypothetical protein|tara:strand:+ start:2753 stop:2974 length:222 start_codon:yes stop_codon:yes gene_type:complete
MSLHPKHHNIIATYIVQAKGATQNIDVKDEIVYQCEDAGHKLYFIDQKGWVIPSPDNIILIKGYIPSFKWEDR